MKNGLIVVALGVLAGCTQPYAQSPLPPDHPANASARETPMPPPSAAFAEPNRLPSMDDDASSGHGGQGADGAHGGHR